MSHTSIGNILHHKLGIRRGPARLVLKELIFLQKINWQKMTEDMLQQVSSDPTFIQRAITGAETWVYEVEIQTCQQAAERRYPYKPKPKKNTK